MYFIESEQTIYSDKKGYFRSSPLTNGLWSVVVSATHYETVYEEFAVVQATNIRWDVTLKKMKEDIKQLQALSVKQISAGDIRNRYKGNISFLDQDRLDELKLKNIEKLEAVIPNFETVYWSGSTHR